MRLRRKGKPEKLQGIDTAARRVEALSNAVKMLAPALVAIRAKHGDYIARAVLQAAIDDCEINTRQRGQSPALRIAHDNDA